MKRLNERQEREDYHAALICSVLAEVNRNRKKRSRPFSPADFMPRYGKKKKMTDNHLKEKIRLINLALGGTEKHGQ